MIYEFKSRSAGTVLMNRSFAEAILTSLGREPTSIGVITLEQIPAAIDAIAGIEAGQPDARAVAEHTACFVRMLRQAAAGGRPVTWGV